MRAFRVLTKFVVFGGLLFFKAPGFVCAQEQVPVSSGVGFLPKGDARTQIYGDPNFKEGGQSLFHRKANQNLTLQIDYVEKKIEFLRRPVDSIEPNRSNGLREKFRLMNGFCGPVPTSGPVGPDPEDELDQCIKQYAYLMEFWKMKALSSIGENNDSRVKLQCSSIAPDGSCLSAGDGVVVGVPSESDENKKREQNPAFATAGQLAAFAKGINRLEDTANQDWEKQMFDVLAPTPAEFKNYQSVVMEGSLIETSRGRTKSGPTSGVQHDAARLQAAQELWNNLRSRLALRFQGQAAPPMNGAVIRKEFIQEFEAQVAPNQRSRRRWIYDQARGENVDYTNSVYGQAKSRLASGNLGSNSSVRLGKNGANNPQVDPKSLNSVPTRTGPADPSSGYLGNEQVIVPAPGTGPQRLGENSVTFSPSGGLKTDELQKLQQDLD
jgi:hypothetical protein